MLLGFQATFASLRSSNIRVYLAAQIASNVGTWIQIIAENWLILRLTDSGLALGITNALQFGPLLLFGLYGGVIADRLDRPRLLVATQSTLMVLSTTMGLLVATNAIRLWMIWLAALLLGLIMSIDKPALLSFIKDLAGEADLPNAVALNNAVISSGRMIGPVLSGLLIASSGVALAFFTNALSFGIVVLVLILLDKTRLHPPKLTERRRGQVREALSYIRRDPVLMPTALAMSVVFVAAYNFQVLMPLLAFRALDGSSELYGVVMSCLGLGAVAGSLLIASRVKPGNAMVGIACGLLSVIHIWLALPLGTYFILTGIFLLGVSCGLFNTVVTATLQVRAPDDMRGRIMAMYSVGILGSGMAGAPLAGALADAAGLPATFLVIAAICAAIAVVTGWLRPKCDR